MKPPIRVQPLSHSRSLTCLKDPISTLYSSHLRTPSLTQHRERTKTTAVSYRPQEMSFCDWLKNDVRFLCLFFPFFGGWVGGGAVGVVCPLRALGFDDTERRVGRKLGCNAQSTVSVKIRAKPNSSQHNDTEKEMKKISSSEKPHTHYILVIFMKSLSCLFPSCSTARDQSMVEL